jgi:hypothetical protein
MCPPNAIEMFCQSFTRSKVLLKELDLGLINEISAFKRCKKYPKIFWFHVKCKVNALGTRTSSELGSHPLISTRGQSMKSNKTNVESMT